MTMTKYQTIQNPMILTLYLFGIAITTLATSPVDEAPSPSSIWVGSFTKSIDFSKLPSPASYYVTLGIDPASIETVKVNYGDYENETFGEFMVCKEGETAADDCIPCPLDQVCELNFEIRALSMECDIKDLEISVFTQVYHQYDFDTDYYNENINYGEINENYENLFESELDMVALRKIQECDGEVLDQNLNATTAGAEGSP